MAQPIGALLEGDPTPLNLPWCETHIVPVNALSIPNPFSTCLGVENQLGYLSDVFSWVESNPNWTRDRRPITLIQMSSSTWASNSRANADWWYGHFAGLPVGETQPPDEYRDVHTAQQGNYESREDWVVSGDGPNGIPDQFESLIRRIKRAGFYGFRRMVLHLPAGVLGCVQKRNGSGQPIFDATTNLPVFEGSNQSMTQFRGMPPWKQAYFTDAAGAWQQFITEFCTLSAQNPDPYSIEVYIGGGIGQQNCEIGTAATYDDGGDGNTRRINGIVRYEDGDPIQGEVWREEYPRDDSDETLPYPMHHGRIQNIATFWHQIYPWFLPNPDSGRPSCGIYSIWLDASSENAHPNARRWGTVEIEHNPWLTSHGIRIGGEAFPSTTQFTVLDDCAVANMRWLGLSQLALRLHADGIYRPIWTLDRHLSEIHILDNMDWMKWNEWKICRTKGYVCGTGNVYDSVDVPGEYHSYQGELMKRWYSVGEIVVADFNGDGRIITDPGDPRYDLNAAYSAFTESTLQNQQYPGNPVWPVVFANGDIDGNGVINIDDWIYFESCWQAYVNLGQRIRHDYTNANHDY